MPGGESDDGDTVESTFLEGGEENDPDNSGSVEKMSRSERNNAKWMNEANEKLSQKGFADERGCVDCWCLLVLVAFIGTMVYLTGYAYSEGNVSKLTAPLDADNNFCGIGAYTEYPYLYLTDVNDVNIMQIFSSGICVKECPTSYEEGIDCMVNDKVTSCEVSEELFYVSEAYVEFCLPADWDSVPA